MKVSFSINLKKPFVHLMIDFFFSRFAIYPVLLGAEYFPLQLKATNI